MYFLLCYVLVGLPGHNRLICLGKPMGAREWNVMVCIFLDQGVVPSGGVALLEYVCHWAWT